MPITPLVEDLESDHKVQVAKAAKLLTEKTELTKKYKRTKTTLERQEYEFLDL